VLRRYPLSTTDSDKGALVSRRRTIAISGIAATAALLTVTMSPAAAGSAGRGKPDHHPVSVDVKSPERGNNAGIAGAAWFVDLDLDYPGGANGLHQAGFTAPQLTGPGVHNNAAPAPGSFSTGRDDHLPGLVVLTSTTNSTLPGFSGPGTNLANLFNITGVTNRTRDETEIWDTWIVGAPIAGVDVDTTLTVAVVDDLNHNGIYDDAPNVVTDLNHDGRIDKADLAKLGVASNIETVRFHLNGAGL
jgi:hypothetical protein